MNKLFSIIGTLIGASAFAFSPILEIPMVCGDGVTIVRDGQLTWGNKDAKSRTRIALYGLVKSEELSHTVQSDLISMAEEIQFLSEAEPFDQDMMNVALANYEYDYAIYQTIKAIDVSFERVGDILSLEKIRCWEKGRIFNTLEWRYVFSSAIDGKTYQLRSFEETPRDRRDIINLTSQSI